MLTPPGNPPPPTAADTAHSAHSTQPALRPHRATPRVEDKPPQTRRPHSIGRPKVNRISSVSTTSVPLSGLPYTMQRKSAVLYQLCHFPSKRLEEKWHNWYSSALFLYKTSARGGALTRMPQSYDSRGSIPGCRKWLFL